jgi:3-hydroxypropanoate dehydrogenase
MQSLPQQSLDQLFLNARSHSVWQDRPVSDEKLKQIYELMKWGPTSANASPARIVFVKSDEAKEKLLACVAELNLEKTRKCAGDGDHRRGS